MRRASLLLSMQNGPQKVVPGTVQAWFNGLSSRDYFFVKTTLQAPS